MNPAFSSHGFRHGALPRKIGIACDWFLPRIGGMELHMQDLARNLLARGIDAQIITSQPGPKTVDGIRVHRLSLPLLPGVQLCYGRRAEREVTALLEREEFDLIHGHYLLSPLTHGCIYLARRLGIPTVFTHHSIIDVLHNRPALLAIPLLGSLFGAVLFRRCIGFPSFRADRITAVSRAVAADTTIAFREPGVAVLPNGIALRDWQCERRPGPKIHVVSVMRLTRSKCPLSLIRAVPVVNAMLPLRLRPVFSIYGDGPLSRMVRAEISRLNLQKQVRLMGFRDRTEIREAYGRARLFVIPSKREGFGIAALEALAAGIPVVGMNRGGLREVVEHGRTGLLVDTPGAFASAIAELILRDDLWRAMSREAPVSARRFSWDRVIRRHLEIYADAMGLFTADRLPGLSSGSPASGSRSPRSSRAS